MIKEFKEFISRGNVMDMAVGVVVGGAFTAIVTSIVEGLITPLVGLVISAFGVENVGKLEFTFNGVDFKYGMVISGIIAFFITAFVVFMLVKGVNKVQSSAIKQEEEVAAEEPAAPTQEELLTEIRDLLSKK
ncbi:large conductance mechanosensitive channel protein MscL [Vagococcus coleopterorum]|uniref:Large-conductance mechanosensitive channel n=1 Tax=Vagococcus coleopterorum TaxID=2714946 RepID=A0A6G8ALH3_9ENTE|nr:large conductance mechanosensitive channel protein MscL [Vagococcus coleopterorum]QIL45908.1 large conductance mechanosensitive channel protein MscL [Vagococcus coleopterorum]